MADKKKNGKSAKAIAISNFVSRIGDVFVVAGGSLLLLGLGFLVIAAFLYVLKSLLGINIIADFSFSGTLLGK